MVQCCPRKQRTMPAVCCQGSTAQCRSGVHAPLAVLCHLNGTACRHRGAAVSHTQHLHGLPFGPPLAMSVEHRRVHTLPGWVCAQREVRGQALRLGGGGGLGRAPGEPYRFHSWGVGPHPHGWDTFPSGPGGESRSSSPGSPWGRGGPREGPER